MYLYLVQIMGLCKKKTTLPMLHERRIMQSGERYTRIVNLMRFSSRSRDKEWLLRDMHCNRTLTLCATLIAQTAIAHSVCVRECNCTH